MYVIVCISAVLSASGLSAMIRRHEPTSAGKSFLEQKKDRVLRDAWSIRDQFPIDRLAYRRVLPKTLVKFNEITQELVQESQRYPYYAPLYTHALQSLNAAKQYYDNNPLNDDNDINEARLAPRRLTLG